MNAEAFEELVSDIKQNGLRYPIIKDKETDLILDGRNRYLACEKAKVAPRFDIWDGKPEDILGIVVSLNVKRRHLDIQQRAEVALKLIDTKFGEKLNRWSAKDKKMTVRAAAKLFGISEDTLQRARKIEAHGVPQLKTIVSRYKMSYLEAAQIASQSPAEQRRILRQAATIRAVKFSENHKQRITAREEFQAQDLPQRTFDVLLVDPPWFYTDQTLALALNPHHHYPTMKDEELAALPFDTISNPDSVIFMWATSLTLKRALDLMSAWRFEYLSSIVWVKTKKPVSNENQGELVELALSHVFGNGPILMAHEYLLVGKRGKGLGRSHFQPRSVLFDMGGGGASQKTVHSQKPVAIYEWIEKMWPSTTKVELFSRATREGWTTWGFEV